VRSTRRGGPGHLADATAAAAPAACQHGRRRLLPDPDRPRPGIVRGRWPRSSSTSRTSTSGPGSTLATRQVARFPLLEAAASHQV